jgi:hypothetical protein
MFIKVTKAHCTEYETHKFTAFASDLKFPVGQIPTKLVTDLGNGLNFSLQQVSEDASEFVYKQMNGCLYLTVFND